MGMHALIEDTRLKAMEAARCWEETDQAKTLLEKVDAYERLSDRFSGEVSEAAAAFCHAASEAQDELDRLRGDALNSYADLCSDDRQSEEWFMAWEDADAEAISTKRIVARARRAHAGDTYIEGLRA
jgi:hypothetical protein